MRLLCFYMLLGNWLLNGHSPLYHSVVSATSHIQLIVASGSRILSYLCIVLVMARNVVLIITSKILYVWDNFFLIVFLL